MYEKWADALNRNEIKTNVINVLAEIQESSGRAVPEIGEDTCPMQDLEGFDSLNSVEASCMLSDCLNFDVDPKLLVPSKPGEVLYVKDIVDRLCEATTKPEGGRNGRSRV
jgi:acyl carrier protein